jgi:hypothetical protein
MMPTLMALCVANRKARAHKLWKAARRAGHGVGRDQVATDGRAAHRGGLSAPQAGRHHRLEPVEDSYDNAFAETTSGLSKNECVRGPDAAGVGRRRPERTRDPLLADRLMSDRLSRRRELLSWLWGR